MKKFFLIIAVIFSTYAFSQEMRVHKTDGTIESFSLSQIDSITFNITSVIPGDGLIAYYPFNGNANDESGNGNNGTLDGPALTVDRFGAMDNAYNFVGNDLNKIVVSPFVPPAVNSISIWFNPATDGPTGLQTSVLFSNIKKYVNHDAIMIYMYAGQIFFGIRNSNGTGYSILSNTQIALNQWHHVVCVIDDQKQLRMYLDGVPQTQTGIWIGGYNGQTVSNIGNFIDDDDNFDGSLDDIRIYNRALTEYEILLLYHENGWTN